MLFLQTHIDYFKEILLTLLPAITLLNIFQSVSHKQEPTSSSNLKYSGTENYEFDTL